MFIRTRSEPFSESITTNRSNKLKVAGLVHHDKYIAFIYLTYRLNEINDNNSFYHRVILHWDFLNFKCS